MTDTADAFDADEGGGSNLLASLPAILWQRKLLLIVPLILCTLAGIAAAMLLPRNYRSSALLLVESQNLPMSDSSNPVGDVVDRRIAKIRQQILSRPDLVELIQANDLYNASQRKEPLSTLVERMRKATSLSAVDADISAGGRGGGSGSAAIAFSLSFDYPQPVPAQIVAQAFVDQLLKLDASETLSQADANVRFLTDQQTNVQSQVSALEGEMNRISGQNGLALANAGGGAIMMGGGGGYETQIAALQRDNAQLAAQIGGNSIERNPAVAAAEMQLASARAIYADGHPDIKIAESRVAAARAATGAGRTNAGDQAIRQQIATNNQLIGDINRARASEQGRAAQVLAAQARGPVVAQKVSQLQSRVESLRANLARINAGLVNAQSMAKLATEQRGERLTLVDPPVTPEKPTTPSRFLMAAGGAVAGAALGVGLVLLIELVLQPIRSVGVLTRLTGTPPLGVVPVINRRASGRPGRRWLRRPRMPSLRLPRFRRRKAGLD